MGPYCKFCHSRCFSHFPKGTPKDVLKAYGSSTIIATCRQGQEFEKAKVGYCYDDIKSIIAKADHLTIPSQMNSDDAIYWIDRAKELHPGEDIKIKVGE